MRTKPVIAGIAAVLLSCTAAQAAPPEHPPAAGHPDNPVAGKQKGCSPGERLQSGESAPKLPETTGENLSDKLARNDGVLCPPNVDPEIRAPTPDAGKTPVIPPPGSPGGDQSVQPK